MFVVSLLLLSGCGWQKYPMQPALDLRTALLERGCRFTAEVCANYGSDRFEWTVDCSCAPDGAVELTIVAPDSIAGITASVDAQGEQLSFEGTGVTFGLLADGQIAPVSLPQVLTGCWRSEYIREAGFDDDYTTAVYVMGYDEKEVVAEQWLDETGTPVYADLWHGGENIASVRISEFQYGAVAGAQGAE